MPGGLDLERLGGATPAATAACAAISTATGEGTHAVVATGTVEALTAAPFGRTIGGPVLLAGRDDLPGETVTALTELGIDEVTLVGAASERVVTALDTVVDTVHHLHDEDVTALSLELSGRLGDHDRVYVAAADPASLLVAATAAVREGAGLLVLTGPAPDGARAVVADREQLVAVGHPTALPDAWLAPLRAAAPLIRVDGRDGAGTAAAVARHQTADGRIHLVTASSDGLAHAVAAPHLAQGDDGPLLLIDPDGIPVETDRWLRLGGPGADRDLRLVGPAPAAEGLEELEAVATAVADGPPQPEVRGAWAHLFDASLKTRSGITTFLDQAVDAGLNTVIVQVARRQDAYYASAVLPRTTDPALEPDLDLLAELVPRARARGLAVHAWVAVVQAWHPFYEELPAPDGWVWTAHGPGSDEPWVTRPHPDRAAALGYPDAVRDYPYLDLGVPAVHDHITAMLVEIATRHPVDAIHLDYLRYPGQAWGYHPVALRRYAEETGASIDPPPAVDDPEWSEWRRAQGTRLLERIRAEVTAARPGTGISAAVIAQGEGPAARGGFGGTVAFSELMQNWPGWVRDGLVDLTIPMVYFDERRYADRYDQWVDFANSLVAEGADVAIGQASWLNPSALSLDQAERALSDTRGLVLYSYQQDTWCPAGTTETGEPCSPVEPPMTLWRRLADGPFREPAPPG